MSLGLNISATIDPINVVVTSFLFSFISTFHELRPFLNASKSFSSISLTFQRTKLVFEATILRYKQNARNFEMPPSQFLIYMIKASFLLSILFKLYIYCMKLTVCDHITLNFERQGRSSLQIAIDEYSMMSHCQSNAKIGV